MKPAALPAQSRRARPGAGTGKRVRGSGGMNSSLKTEAGSQCYRQRSERVSPRSRDWVGPCLPSFNGMPPSYTLLHHQHPWW